MNPGDRPANEPDAPPADPRGRIEEPARTVDLDRLRAGAAAALRAERPVGAPTPAQAMTSPRPAGPSPATPPTAGSRWVRVGLPVVLAAALATAGVTALGDDPSEVATTPPTAAAPVSTTAVPTTAAPTTAVPTIAAPTTAAPTTAAPTTTAPAAAPDPAAEPPHRATYRGGKLYLEGRVSSAEEAQRYIDKAAAVLGPDNVVDNYTVDPAVPPSTDGTVYVDEPFLFDTGSADLNPAYTGVLGLGIAALRLNPGARMVVTGYTDSRGDPARNQELSEARALAVVDYMVTTGGIDRARFDAVGAGDRNPVGDNATEEGRRLNRRIDVRFVNLLG